MRSKVKTREFRRKTIGLGPRPKRFAETVTMDHMLAYTDGAKSIKGQLNALMFYDRGKVDRALPNKDIRRGGSV